VTEDGAADGWKAINGASVRKPRIRERTSGEDGEVGEMSAQCRISAPPMEWPIRNRGAEVAGIELRKEVMSERTREVPPVRPFSEGAVTERPQPL
jgi:hypothetical protein